MSEPSVAGADDGLANPETVENVHVSDGDDYAVSGDGSWLVTMWDGNGYDRDSCWIQADEDAVCDLSSWL